MEETSYMCDECNNEYNLLEMNHFCDKCLNKKILEECSHKYEAVKIRSEIHKTLVVSAGHITPVKDIIESIKIYCTKCGEIIE